LPRAWGLRVFGRPAVRGPSTLQARRLALMAVTDNARGLGRNPSILSGAIPDVETDALFATRLRR